MYIIRQVGNMIKKDKIKVLLICAVFILWTCVPVGFNIAFSINIGQTVFRFNVWLSTIILLFLIFVRRNHSTSKFDRRYIVFLSFVFISGLFIFFRNSIYSISSLFDGLLIILLPFLFFKSLRTIKNEKLLELFIFVVKLVGAFIILQVFSTEIIAALRKWTDQTNLDRGFSTIGESNATAYFLLSISILLFLEFLRKKSKFDLIILLCSCIAILRSQTRAAIGILCIFCFIIFCFLYKAAKIKFFFGVMVGLIALAFFDVDIFINIYERVFTESSSGSNTLRSLLLEEGLNAANQKIVFGWGIGLLINRISRMGRYITDIGNPHNQWVALLAETGIVGVFLFCLSLPPIFKAYKEQCKSIKIIKWCFAVFILSSFMFETLFTAEIRTTICFWMFPCMLHCYSIFETSKSDSD